MDDYIKKEDFIKQIPEVLKKISNNIIVEIPVDSGLVSIERVGVGVYKISATNELKTTSKSRRVTYAGVKEYLLKLSVNMK